MLENLNSILQDAYEGRYAVGSFNFYNYESLRGIIEAGVKGDVPIIAAFGKKYLPNMSLNEVVAIVKATSERLAHPVCLHLDHCNDIDIIREAIAAGFTSVMYDGSMLPYEENMARTKVVCDLAHAAGVSVEAELGSLAAGKNSHEGSADDREVYTDPEAARAFVEQTGVDALAVSIGTVHGLYKGTPCIRTDILAKINEQCQIPLVLHGGSGTPEQKIRECIANGIAKINVNTEISDYVVRNTKELLEAEAPHFSVLALRQQAWASEVVLKYMNMFR